MGIQNYDDGTTEPPYRPGIIRAIRPRILKPRRTSQLPSQGGSASPNLPAIHAPTRVDADTHKIVAAELTSDDVGDVSELPGLLDQIDAEMASLTADGAYDGEVVYDAVASRIQTPRS